jgi:DNA-binding GntR family transcriptional regulator
MRKGSKYAAFFHTLANNKRIVNKIINEIIKLEAVSSFSKNDRIVQGVINSINEKLIGQGEILPSVNNMIRELRFSRETIVKGYKDLISRGIIEAKNRRGYFVSNDNTGSNIECSAANV